MQQAITPGIGHISKKNPFMPGDAVVHMSSKQRGIVVQVSRDWAKFELLGEKGRNGQPVYRRFSYHKLTLLATQEQLKQGFEMFQKQRQVMEKKANSPFNRLARRITQFFAPKAQAEPQVAG